MSTKMKLEKGKDDAHAFLELMMDGVQVWMDEARHAVDMNCEEAVPEAMEWVARDAKVVGDFVWKAKDGWLKAGDDDAGEAVVEMEAEEFREILGVMRKGIESELDTMLDRARMRDYRGAACRMQDLGEALRAAADVFWGMEKGDTKKGGEA